MSAKQYAKNALFATIKWGVCSLLKFDKYVIKRFTGLETPLYKIWWGMRSRTLHTQLASLHAQIVAEKRANLR